MKSLQKLFLRENLIYEIPDEFGELGNLNILSLRNNNLFSVSKCFSKLTKLQVLDLNYNQINNFCDVSLPKLISLSVQYNHLTTFGSGLSFPFLNSLLLGYNNIECLDPKFDFSSMKFLTELNLDNNKLKEIPPNIFASTSLQKLSLSSNKFLKTIPKEIKNLKKLQLLNLR